MDECRIKKYHIVLIFRNQHKNIINLELLRSQWMIGLCILHKVIYLILHWELKIIKKYNHKLEILIPKFELIYDKLSIILNQNHDKEYTQIQQIITKMNKKDNKKIEIKVKILKVCFYVKHRWFTKMSKL
jgi:hypothetical protein